MSTLEAIVQDLKTLPPQSLEVAAFYVHQLKLGGTENRQRALESAFGSISVADADEMERAIRANCEKIDADQW